MALKQTTSDMKAQLSDAARSKPAESVVTLLASNGVDVVNCTTKSVDDVLRDVDGRIVELVKVADLAAHQTRQVALTLNTLNPPLTNRAVRSSLIFFGKQSRKCDVKIKTEIRTLLKKSDATLKQYLICP